MSSPAGLPVPSINPNSFAQFPQPMAMPWGGPMADTPPALSTGFIPQTWASPGQGMPSAATPFPPAFQGQSAVAPQSAFNPLQALRAASLSMPRGKKLRQLLDLPLIDPNELFTHRLLCRRGIALFVGPSGVGKSTFITQGLVRWALGREHCGFNPLKPLRCLIVQAENDDHDLREQFHSTVQSLKLSADQFEAVNAHITIVTVTSTVGDEFCEILRRLIIEHSADLVVIDPALAYLGGDANSQVDVGHFLRKGIAPVLMETNSAAILVHHVAKPPSGRAGSGGRSDSYAGAGSAEFSNVSRLVFGISPTDVPDHYELFLGKRGKRAGWRDEDGNLITKRILRHSREAGELLWCEVPHSEFQALKEDKPKSPTSNSEPAPTIDEFVSLFPVGADGPPEEALLTTDDIKARCLARGWSGYAKLRDAAVARGDLDVLTGARNSKLTGRPEVISRARALRETKTP